MSKIGLGTAQLSKKMTTSLLDGNRKQQHLPQGKSFFTKEWEIVLWLYYCSYHSYTVSFVPSSFKRSLLTY